MDAIELDMDGADDELVEVFAVVVRDLALERRDLTDPLTAIEADRRLAECMPGCTIEFVPSALLAPPVWSVHRDGTARTATPTRATDAPATTAVSSRA